MPGAIEATGLGKRYGHSWALRDCSLSIPAGRIAGIVGPNGAGKTTLLHLAVGLLRPSAGEIRVFGRSPQRDLLVLLDRIGFLAQETPLYRSYSVADMLEFGRRLNRGWDSELVEGRLRGLDIPFDQRVGQLSGGQRAQVALALAMGKRPDLLILDEPVASLDPLARREFMQSLATTVAETNLTVVLSSHLVSDLERVCDFIVIINGGQVQLAGELERVLAEHHLLIGTRLTNGIRPAGVEIVKEEHAERSSSLWVRGPLPPLPPQWRQESLPLEELVIAYLSAPQAGALPAPKLAASAP